MKHLHYMHIFQRESLWTLSSLFTIKYWEQTGMRDLRDDSKTIHWKIHQVSILELCAHLAHESLEYTAHLVDASRPGKDFISETSKYLYRIAHSFSEIDSQLSS